MNRRTLLVSLFVGTLAFLRRHATPWLSAWTAGSLRVVEVEVHKLFSSPMSASVVGRRYLELFPEKSCSKVLLQELPVFSKGLIRGSDRQALRREIRQQCRREFLEGNTVLIDGWILARSEAALCALVALRS